MALLVQKFGGTSVGDIDRIDGVAERVLAARNDGHQVVVVVSAMAGETDRLLRLAGAISTHGRPNPRELDVLLATGEQVTIALLCMALEKAGVTGRSYTGSQAGILTDQVHGRGRIEQVKPDSLLADLERGRVPVVAGFQGQSPDGSVVTLGRGGSDTTAVALAAALKADECQIFTDVDGVYTADPRLAPDARRLEHIGFEEMLEMAGQGSKVLQIRSVEFARRHSVPLRVLSTFESGNGTLIIDVEEESSMEAPLITGIACDRQAAHLRLRRLPAGADTAHRLLAPLADANIEVDFISQSLAENGCMDFNFTVNRSDYELAREILAPHAAAQQASISGNPRVAKVSVIGLGVRTHASIVARVLGILAKAGMQVHQVATTQIRVSVLVDELDAPAAVQLLHDEFELARVTAGAKAKSRARDRED